MPSTGTRRVTPSRVNPVAVCRPWGGQPKPLDDVVDALRQRLDVVRLDGREHGDPQLVAAELAVRARCRRCRWRAATLATAAASTASSKSIVPTTCERAAGSATNGVAYVDASAQPYSRADESAVRATAQSRPPLPLHPVELVGEQEQRRDRRGVVGLVLAGVVDRGRQRRKSGIQRSDARDLARRAPARPGRAARATGRRRRRSTSAARSSRRRSARRRPAGRRPPRSRRSRTSAPSSGARRPGGPGPSRRSRSRCAARRRRRRPPRRAASGSVPGSALMTVRRRRGTAPCRRPGRTWRRTRRRRRCCARSLDQAERRDVPERGRAAVAEDDLVAVGQREQLAQARRGPGRPGS